MPSYVSIGGKLYPQREKCVVEYPFDDPLPKKDLNPCFKMMDEKEFVEKGDTLYYDGPDREASYFIKKQGKSYLGSDYRIDQNFLQKVRSQNFNSVKDFLEYYGIDEVKEKEIQEEKAMIVQKHQLPDREEELFIAGGGTVVSGDTPVISGGFGQEKVRTRDEVVNKKGQSKK